MAQSIVSNVVGKLGELLIQEVNFLQGVVEELKSLQDEFQWIQAFLKDADASIQGGNERAKTWVNQVRDVAYDAEDIIDNYIFKIHRQYHRVRHGRFFWLPINSCHPCGLTILHDLGIEIGKVKRRTKEISANRSNYGIENITATSSESLTNEKARLPLSWKQTSPVVEEVDVIGFDVHAKALVRRLLRAKGEGRRAVKSIVGMGGLGKTTLAKKVFLDPKIKKHFSCHAWVYISQTYRDRELMESIAKQLMVVDKVRMNESTDEELKTMVYEHLKGRRYLVVIDDVWTRGAWDNIKDVLPDMMNGSKVLLTTRNREVALHADRQSAPFDLKLLGEEESWELFCTKAIPTKCSEQCPPNLETIGREMVARCGGLPLAIVVLGGLALRKEQSEGEWRKLLKSVSWQLREGEDQISKILALSYHHLPYYIKPCFLYFAMFPEDSHIDAEDLQLMWIAEGFIEARDDETMEEVAEEYLEELVHRSLIQVAKRNILGGIVNCRIHDLLLDLAISEAKGTDFLLVTKTNNERITLKKTRRLALHGHNIWDNITWQYYSTDSFSSLRTVRYFDTDGTGDKLSTQLYVDGSMSCGPGVQINKMKCMYVVPGARVLSPYLFRNSELLMTFKLLRTLISSMKLLRVIDLRNVPTIVPNAIGELIHLRYLNVRVVDDTRLPSSIGDLTNLQTLKMERRIWSTFKLPSETWKILGSNLRHLECIPCSIKGQTSTGSLPNLQTLSSVKAGKWLCKGSLEKMINLRKLSVYNLSLSYGKAFSDSLGKLSNLIELKIKAEPDHELPTSLLTASHHVHLRVLHLNAQLERLPEVSNQCLLTNLIHLSLLNSKLKEDPLVTLGKLDNLQFLKLRTNVFAGKEMACLEKGFPQLNELIFVNLKSLEEWKIEDEAMPRLRTLVIDHCSKLRMLPDGLGRITSLQELNVRSMPSVFTQRLRVNDGDDWHKVRRIRIVTVD